MLFRKEKRSLRLLNCLKHPNIIPFLGAYIHGDNLSFLFPCIDMDLSAFFQKSSRYGDFYRDFTFYSALLGLASALSNVHNIRLRASTEGLDFSGIGYHHDLRPPNILVSKETFILADFGMGNLKAADQGSQSKWKAGSGDYLAPECMDENLIHQDVGRSIDVWAFGCLLAEVATFIQMGARGLTRFCTTRLSPGLYLNCETSYFHDDKGNIKDSVKQWLGFLNYGGDLPALNKPLYNLILEILVPGNKRPTIAEICPRLALLCVKSHFFAVLECLTEALEAKSFEIPATTGSMRIWFEKERLRAFGHVLCLYDIDWNASILKFIDQENAICVGIMVQLFKIFRPSQVDIEVQTGVTSELNVSTVQASFSKTMLAPPESRTTEFLVNQELEVQRLIQELWDMLPKAQLKKVENIWVNSMLETDDIDQLSHLEKALSLDRSNAYQKGAAMAMMRKLRLEMIRQPTSSSELRDLEFLPTDMTDRKDVYGHKIGVFKNRTAAIIEWMYYDDSWENISPSERTTVMALKAKGFGIEHKPESLRMLHCLGFVEQTDGRIGYGFIYEIPQKDPVIDPAATTLLQQLILSVKMARTEQYLNQPLLGDKYRLAYMLADCLMEFHSIGWLHENFHSNNILFFDEPPNGQTMSPTCSSIITEPYVVGLHKSRPGTNAWHTQGPAQEADFLDYRHPAYATTRHFRNSYDYYSFGLVLLEIGLWTPLKVWSKKSDHRTMSPDAFRDALVRTYVPRLGPRMGEVYRDIVTLLLTDGLDPSPEREEPDPELERDAFKKFFNEIVDPLAALSGAPL